MYLSVNQRNCQVIRKLQTVGGWPAGEPMVFFAKGKMGTEDAKWWKIQMLRIFLRG